MKAFPKTGSIEFCDPQTGMDLRDYFAAKALNGLINYSPEPEEHKLIAELCYQLADAMMKAREKG